MSWRQAADDDGSSAEEEVTAVAKKGVGEGRDGAAPRKGKRFYVTHGNQCDLIISVSVPSRC